jgi:nicotinamidase-related amidase
MKPVLLLVDLQNDLLCVGDLEPHPGSIVAAAADLLNVCRTSAVPVTHVWSTVDKSGDNRMPHRKKNAMFGCRRLYHLAEANRRFSPARTRRNSQDQLLHCQCSVDLPFGGWKASGIGPAEHGPANREFFTRIQAPYFA